MRFAGVWNVVSRMQTTAGKMPALPEENAET